MAVDRDIEKSVLTATSRRVKIFGDIIEERIRQERLKREGKFKHTCAEPDMLASEKYLVLAEETGEVARAILNLQNFSRDYGADLGKVRKELIEVAAVSVAWIEFIDSVLYGEPSFQTSEKSDT